MKNFYIIANSGKEEAKKTVEVVESYLRSHGAFCRIEQRESRDGAAGCGSCREVPEDTDCIITIGGDGTLIQAARGFSHRGIPLVGINRGHLGYLTQVSRDEDIREMANALLADQYQIEERMMLDGRIIREGKEIVNDIALNEIVLTHRDVIRVLRFGVYVNSEFLNEYTADGLIAATPTGSTAYNLSAGGPIVAPNASMTVLTPICSHALNARSIVLSADDEICIEVREGSQAAVFDGDTILELRKGDQVIITKSRRVTRLIRLRQVSFLENLSNKLAGV